MKIAKQPIPKKNKIKFFLRVHKSPSIWKDKCANKEQIEKLLISIRDSGVNNSNNNYYFY
jgi:hypothetical protein